MKSNERKWNERNESWRKTIYWSGKFTAIFSSKIESKIFEECKISLRGRGEGTDNILVYNVGFNPGSTQA